MHWRYPLLGSLAASYLGTDNIAVAEAASYKNPFVEGSYGEIDVLFYKTHKLTSVKIDGKSKSLNGWVWSRFLCDNYDNYYGMSFKASKGRHKVEVKDNKGYWVVDYATVK